ncbi:hypothetical protein [Sphingomonas sp. PP-CE-1G-424]|uniref:hypothetical protein n=1 Tax=Sphingomonas sp. PP-CE-1G-424 TaxID=2135658 RepID=UPI001404FA35|nr:hypothetical protein [Sphingomonas sp. PP-CE-1G-424]
MLAPAPEQTIRIVSLYPSRAALNLGDRVYRRHPPIQMNGWLAVVFVIPAAA